jgi:small subunit ribosomal protein S6
MKNFYETTFIVNASIDDEQIDGTVKQVEDLIVKNGGEILSVDRIGRRRLAYPIAKKHQGFYACIEFKAEGRSIDKVERFYQLDENVLRYLTLQLSKREIDAKHQRIALLTREENPPPKEEESPEAKAAAEKAAAEKAAKA